MKLFRKLLTTRRHFLKTSACATGALAAPTVLRAAVANVAPPSGLANTTPLRVGLVGCGGRGTGAANQALRADPNVVLTALADAFDEPVQKGLQLLKAEHPDKVKVAPDHCFAGLDAYKKLIDSGVDVVLLASPPAFRPAHLKAAVEAGKHVFCEKPIATDSPGVRSVIESAARAREKSLSIVAGFCWRYDTARREFYQRIHEGAIGDIRAVHATFYSGPVKPMPAPGDRPAGMGDLEWQIRNWYNFFWLSGDGYVEQACHSVDKAAWALKDRDPLKAVAVGGRQTPNHQGNIFDHMFVTYEFPEDVRVFVGQRQIAHTYSDVSDCVLGSSGVGKITGWQGPTIKGKENWRYKGPKTDMFQNEHNELFASIRSGKPLNDGAWMAHSTLMAIMGRMAAYTGQEVTWEQALNSTEKLVPDVLDWKMKFDIQPMAVPGTTKIA